MYVLVAIMCVGSSCVDVLLTPYVYVDEAYCEAHGVVASSLLKDQTGGNLKIAGTECKKVEVKR